MPEKDGGLLGFGIWFNGGGGLGDPPYGLLHLLCDRERLLCGLECLLCGLEVLPDAEHPGYPPYGPSHLPFDL